MATTPYPLPREKRETSIDVGNGTIGPYGPSGFKIFDTADVAVFVRTVGAEFFTDAPVGTTVTKTSGQPFDTFSVTFPIAVPATTEFIFQSRRVHGRDNAVTKGGTISANELEKELSKQGSVVEELRRDIDRSVRVDPGEMPLKIKAGATGELMKTDANGNISGSGENAETIQGSTAAAAASAIASAASAGNAAASAAAASNNAGNAAGSATSASTSATNAANSATAAANSVAALPFNFSTTITDADPGAGNFRLNNATPGSATAAYIDNVDSDGVTATGVLNTWDDSTNTVRGTLTVRSKTDATIRHVYNVTGAVVDGTGYRKLTLAYVGGAGSFTNGMGCWLIFDRTGDAGEVTLNGVQTMSNKTFEDATTFFADNLDATKKLTFQLSGFTTAMTRTVTWPDASGTVLLTAADATLTAGIMGTAANDGTKSSGTYTPTPLGGNFKTITNGGAFALAAPTQAGSYNMEIDITNNATAGAITFTGFVTGNPKGDPLTTTNGNKFKLHISKTAAGVTATMEACQ